MWIGGALLILSATGLTWSRYAGGNFDNALTALDAHQPQLATALAGGVTAVLGRDDPGGALDEVRRDGDQSRHVGQSFGVAAWAASKRAVTSAQFTRFHSRST
ncbi:hypothetical protein A6A27_40620 [Micromonospora sp. CB01531]|nr:hypothetical protein A6A27_40620 [Micromonospora sp. CB01531]